MRCIALLKSRCLHASALAALLVLPAAARAGSIDLDTFQLQADTPKQQVQIFVDGGDATPGAALSISPGDGSRSVGARIQTPELSAVDLFANGSIVASTNSGGMDDPSVPVMSVMPNDEAGWKAAISQNGPLTLGMGPIDASAEVAAATSSFKSNPFTVALGDPISANVLSRNSAVSGSELANSWLKNSAFDALPRVQDVIPNVPEPASLGLLGFVLPALLMRRRQKPVSA